MNNRKIVEMSIEELSEMEVHEVAGWAPMLKKVDKEGSTNHTIDLNSLATSMSLTGQRIPVIVWDNKLMDGRNRLEAGKLLKMPTLMVEIFEGTEAEAVDHVVAVNVRRDMTKDQRAVYADHLLAWESGQAEKRRLANLKQGNAAPVKEEVEAESDSGRLREDAVVKGKASEIVGAQVGVSGRHIERYQRIKRTAEEESPRGEKAQRLLNGIQDGRTSIAEATNSLFGKVDAPVQNDDPIKVFRTRINTAVSNIKAAISELAHESVRGIDDYEFVGRKITEIVEHFESEFGVIVDVD